MNKMGKVDWSLNFAGGMSIFWVWTLLIFVDRGFIGIKHPIRYFALPFIYFITASLLDYFVMGRDRKSTLNRENKK